MRRVHGGVLAAVLCAGSLLLAESHPFSVDDMVAMKRISDPNVSPDGNTVVFGVRSTDLEANRGSTDLWLVNTDGSGLRQLTSHPASDVNPRWGPDGRYVYFLSSRSGSSQVWRIPVAGGEAARVSKLPLDVGSLLIAPDGETMVVSMEVYPDCDTLACTVDRLEDEEERNTTGVVFDRLFVRHWDTWKDGRRAHLFSLPGDGGEAVDLMKGLDGDCPSKPFGGPEEAAISPNGRDVVFTARVEGDNEPWSTDFDLYRVPIDGSRSPECLTVENRAWDTQPTFSPDGRELAYLAMTRPGFEADRFRIVTMEWPSGQKRILTEQWDRSPNSLVFSSDGKTIYAVAANLGQQSLFAVDAKTGRAREVLREGNVGSVSPSGDCLVFGYDHLRSPIELHTIRRDGMDMQAITALNEPILASIEMGEPEQFNFEGWNGETVYAYVVKPVDFEPSKKYPVAFLIHGGPQGSFGNHFHYRWNPQTYAGAGYAVVMVDFHGSTGYGQEFTDSISGDWGGKPLVDLRKGLEAALKRYSWLDAERIGALGASYGGYMINWIEGNWPDRFRCLVNHDGVFDMRTMYYSTEELWFPEWEHGGPYWENPQGHEEHNPAGHVEKWGTPMLVVHGAYDFRIPLEQGLAAFTALQRRGVPSKLLYFPDENHWVLKPQNSVQWHQVVISWLDQWVKPVRDPGSE